MKKRLILIGVTCAVLFAVFFGGYVYGLNIYEKTLDAMGFLNITDEVGISEMEIDDSTTLKVQCEPTGNTQADLTYTVHAYLDGVDTAQETLSWSAAEIISVTKKKVTFNGLDLGSATSVKAEVTH